MSNHLKSSDITILSALFGQGQGGHGVQDGQNARFKNSDIRKLFLEISGAQTAAMSSCPSSKMHIGKF